MTRTLVRIGLVCLALAVADGPVGAQTPADQITIAFDVSIAPSFLEPAETPGNVRLRWACGDRRTLPAAGAGA